ncbi:LppW family protein [Geodermatophilus sp. CPCC 206100]|uniref:LppW family protein n=1 Tax=Geodermatophilus sp. CPCC 206100 TaxID=3020054 RepID=UPI003B002F7E
MPGAVPARLGLQRTRVPVLLPVVMVLALSLAALPARPAAASAPALGNAVAEAAGAFGSPGTLAVVITPQHGRVAGLTARALEARTARLVSATADNGQADRVFPTASLVKLFVAEGLLHRARTGRVALSPGDLATLQDMIARSSDPAASQMWVRFDGPGLVREVAVRYGLRATAPPRASGQWGETTTTARDLARFLAALPVVAAPDDAATLTGWMTAAAPQGADGFDQRFGLLGTAPATPAVKQGWMCCLGGQRHLHSVGVVQGLVVVLLSEVPRSVGWDAGRAALSAAARPLAAVPPPGTP